MDSRKTTNNSKRDGCTQNPSSSSSNKLLRPRTAQKYDANSTFLYFRSPNMSSMNTTRMLNQTFSQNMDVSLSVSRTPWMKPSMTMSQNASDVQDDLAYNKYLQSLMKQQLVKKYTEQYEKILNDQILIHCECLHKVENNLRDVSHEIEDLRENSDVAEFIQTLEPSLSKFEALCSKYDTISHLNELIGILTRQSNSFGVKNIKQIESQEEYDQFMLTLRGLHKVLENIVKINKHVKEVHDLAIQIRSFKEMDGKASVTAQKVFESNKIAVVEFLKVGSDMFAQAGGYY